MVGGGLPEASARAVRRIFKALASAPNLLANADSITMWGLTLVGLLLILCLLTRLASAAGMAFILLFYLCNPPFVGYFYSIPTEGSYLIVNKNLVELCALVVIFATGSGPLLERSGV